MTSESVDFAVNGGVEGSSEWPNSLYQFAWFQDRDDKLQDLVDLEPILITLFSCGYYPLLG